MHAELGLGGMPIWPGDVAYEVPVNSGVNTMTCLMTWFGGLVEGQPRIATNRKLWAGPLDDDGNPSGDCTAYDRIYEMTRQDIERFNHSGAITPNLLDWPWQLGAPVLDGDGVEDNYNLDGGDRPALLGDQMFWWIMNDAGGEHWHSQSSPMGMEVHTTAFGYDKPNGPIGNTTFFRYKFVYKGATPLEDAYFSLFPEADLGSKYDNFQGADTTLHMVYVYNADNFDGDLGNPFGESYGDNPPALGLVFLPSPHDGTQAERQEHGNAAFTGLSGFVTETRYRENAAHYYNLMRGMRADGHPFTYGGDGHDFSNTPTTIFYPGDHSTRQKRLVISTDPCVGRGSGEISPGSPIFQGGDPSAALGMTQAQVLSCTMPGDPVTGAFWSQMNIDGQGTLAWGVDESVISTGPFTMQPGDEHEITFAVIWVRGDDHLDSVRRLKTEVARLHQNADTFLSPDTHFSLAGTSSPRSPDPLGFTQNYPNPFPQTTTIRYSLPQSMYVRLRVYDLLGRHHATLVDASQAPGLYEVPFAAEGLPAGVYVYRLELDHLSATRRMVVMR